MTKRLFTRVTNEKGDNHAKKGCHPCHFGCHIKINVKRQKDDTLNPLIISLSFNLSYLSYFFNNNKKKMRLDSKSIKNSLIDITL